VFEPNDVQRAAMKRVVDVLNKGVELHEEALNKLCETRVSVNEGFANSDLPFVVFQTKEGYLRLGFIGALGGCVNAALELPDRVRLCALYEPNDVIRRFYFIEVFEKGGHQEIKL